MLQLYNNLSYIMICRIRITLDTPLKRQRVRSYQDQVSTGYKWFLLTHQHGFFLGGGISCTWLKYTWVMKINMHVGNMIHCRWKIYQLASHDPSGSKIHGCLEAINLEKPFVDGDSYLPRLYVKWPMKLLNHWEASFPDSNLYTVALLTWKPSLFSEK